MFLTTLWNNVWQYASADLLFQLLSNRDFFVPFFWAVLPL